MTHVLVRAVALAAIYLLVMTSLAIGDVVAGLALGVGVALVLRPRHGRPLGPPRSTLGLARLLAGTAAEMVRGTWRTARFCLGAPSAPGVVEIPRGDRTDVEVALWGVLTGEAPDEVPLDVDEERGVLVVHLIDASDPDAVRARHRRAHAALRGQEAG